MWIVCITSVRHVLTVNGYGGRQTKENEKSQCFKGWETLVKLYIDRYLVFDYSNLYERIKQKKEFTQLRCYSTLINEIEDFQRQFDVKYMQQVSGNTALPTEAIIKTEGMIKDIDYSVKEILR